MIMSTFVKTLLILFVSIFTLNASDITQFGPSNVVYDAAQQDDTLWLATYAGLVQYSIPERKVIRIEHSDANMRDIKLQSLYCDPDGTLWAGSANGYFYKKTKRGSWTTFEDFVSSKSSHNQIVPYGNSHLLVAHSTGISIFDMKKERVISTASDFAQEEAGEAYQLKVVGDTLFAGVNKSIVRFDSLSTRLFKIDFRNRNKWDNVETVEFFVKGLTHDGDVIRGFGQSAALIDGVIYYGKSYTEKAPTGIDYDIAYLFRETISGVDSIRIGGTFENIEREGAISSGGEISSIRILTSGLQVVTTTRDYFSLDPFSTQEDGQFVYLADTIPGFVYGSYQKGMISAAGDLWLNSTLDPSNHNPDWWKGVNRYDGETNKFYNRATTGFGTLSGWDAFQGLSDSRDGKIWFGSSADNVKMWDPADDSWYHYVIYDYWDRDDSLYIRRDEDAFAGRFKKVDGIVQDSMGYMWFCAWDGGDDGSKHRFCILDPKTEEYGFLLHRQKGIVGLDAEKAYYPHKAAVDSKGNRFFIDPDDKDYIMIPHNYNPLTDSAAIEVIGTGFFYGKIPGTGKVEQVVTSKSGSVLLASDKGLMLLRSDVSTIEPIEDDRDAAKQDDHYRKKIGSIAIEESYVERNAYRGDVVYDSIVTTIFWASVNEVGVERFTLAERIRNGVSTPVIITSESPIIIPDEKKYYFTNPGQVLIDHKRHELWFSHTEGLIRYKLGFNPTTELADNSESKIYPNPYSKSRHERITIDYLSPNVFIDIYSISGKLLAHFDQNNNKIFESTGRGKIFRWKPSDEWAPGTYLIAIKDSEEKLTEIRKFLIIP